MEMIMQNKNSIPRPILQWAGGKTQLLGKILPKIPKSYGRFIEPFIGGGAVFFAVRPENGIIADINPELINLYKTIASDVKGVISHLSQYKNTEDDFYNVRKLNFSDLSNVEAAARTIFLNRTCFNGLYRVNKAGQFNVSFGHKKTPSIPNEETLTAASILLQNTTIICSNYENVLKENAKKGDFIFSILHIFQFQRPQVSQVILKKIFITKITKNSQMKSIVYMN